MKSFECSQLHAMEKGSALQVQCIGTNLLQSRLAHVTKNQA